MYRSTESLPKLLPIIWNLVPDKLKQLVDIYAFKKKIQAEAKKITFIIIPSTAKDISCVSNVVFTTDFTR